MAVGIALSQSKQPCVRKGLSPRVPACIFREYSIHQTPGWRGEPRKKLRLRGEKLRDTRPRRGPDCVIRIIVLPERIAAKTRARVWGDASY